ncbi:aminodeoxychorismate lyase [Vulcaniibacterium tengchongense]|uniref:Aminodeoxychorismate lyase n=1 Tax=Vulcaniibacterium tengchongense TaxID=1273429 RepID=A0A3N4VIE4_9GAMM|nr:aminodeoxychorismate lyase [Vulcaniibacterium tengchongense]RPE81265.1 4-amino-4-deoxychorismate lyase [Vulcaniibacterium tengchongense]
MTPSPTTLIFRGDRRVDAPGTDDRGLAYGDGLFETMRAHRGALPWWPAHWARLARGADALRLPLPAQAQVREEAARLLAGGDGVLKLVVTRGGGGRGYAPPAPATPTWILSRHPLPPPPPREGLALRWCETRLATQPALAGLKHCNRLEQVLARGEWDDPGIHEGLMRSVEGDAVCATAANLFALRDGAWRTPRLDRCGVAGVCRAWVLEAVQAREARLGADEVETAEAVFLCNAVRGILPVARLGPRAWSPHPQVAELQRRLAAAHPGFATEVS